MREAEEKDEVEAKERAVILFYITQNHVLFHMFSVDAFAKI